MTERTFFPYRIDKRWAPLFTVLRVKDTDGVEITEDGLLRATYGRVKVETPIGKTSITLW